MKKLTRILATGAASMMAVGLLAAPAQAETFAPSCVDRTVYSAGFVMLTNNCSTAQNVKVIVRNGFDSNCLYLKKGDIREVRFGLFGSYHKTIRCGN